MTSPRVAANAADFDAMPKDHLHQLLHNEESAAGSVGTVSVTVTEDPRTTNE